MSKEIYDDTDIINQIDNVMLFKDFLDEVVKNIKNGEYDKKVIKKISDYAETILEEYSSENRMDNLYSKPFGDILDDPHSDNEIEHQFIPRIIEANISDSETDVNIEDRNDISQLSNSSKITDKLVDSFLKDNLNLENYYYTQYFSLVRLNQFTKECFYY